VFPVREDYRCALPRASPRTRSTKTPISSSSRHRRAGCGRTTPGTSDLGSCSARFRVGVVQRGGIHDQIGMGAPYRIFEDPHGRGGDLIS
jgi:hypothetical protein